MENTDKVTQIKQGLEFAKNATNYITVSGVENFKLLTAIYNNLDLFFQLIEKNEIEIIEKSE